MNGPPAGRFAGVGAGEQGCCEHQVSPSPVSACASPNLPRWRGEACERVRGVSIENAGQHFGVCGGAAGGRPDPRGQLPAPRGSSSCGQISAPSTAMPARERRGGSPRRQPEPADTSPACELARAARGPDAPESPQNPGSTPRRARSLRPQNHTRREFVPGRRRSLAGGALLNGDLFGRADLGERRGGSAAPNF